MWFTTVEQDGTTFFLESVLEFQKKFQKMLHPVDPTREWTYRYIVPWFSENIHLLHSLMGFNSLEWPGWGKYPELATKGAKDIKITTNLQYLKAFLVINDELFDYTDFRKFFEGETEEVDLAAPEEVPNFAQLAPLDYKAEHDIDEFGDIGNLEWNGLDAPDFDLDGMSKEATLLAKVNNHIFFLYHLSLGRGIFGCSES